MIQVPKRPIIIVLLVIVLGGVIGSYIYFGGDSALAYDFIVAEKRDLVQDVSVTGRVKPAESVDLAFEKSGKVALVTANISDKVRPGQILVTLENSELLAELSQAEAGVESAEAQLKQYQASVETEQASLAELEQGTRPEEIQIAETKVSNAQNSVEDAELNLNNVQSKASNDLVNVYGDTMDILNDAYTKADNALHAQIDEMFNNDDGSSPKLTFIVTNSQAEIDVELQRFIAGNELEDFKVELDTFSTSDFPSLDQALVNAEGHLVIIRDFLNRLGDAINSSAGISSSTVSIYKSNLNVARVNVNTVISNSNNQEQIIATQKEINQSSVTTAEAQVNDAQYALLSAETELTLKKAGSTLEQITAQKAQVEQAEANVTSQEAQIKQTKANVQNIEARLSKTIVYSPINGIITTQDAKVGEIVSANTIIVSLISEAKFEIEANVPEADIAKVSVGNTSLVTLDAYGRDVVFEAKVVAIDPAETIVDGVATYKVTFQFTKEDERVKSGMTANIDIASDRRVNVIAVPQRSIIRKNGDKFVRILNSEDFEEVKVETGLRGSDGNIEIIKGVNDGDKVITFSEE